MNPDLLVLVPSRGRPVNIGSLAEAFADTTTGHAQLRVILDDDDPSLPGYGQHDGVELVVGPRLRLGPTLNREAEDSGQHRHVGFLGDDHRPRTTGWDRRIVETLDRLGPTGIVYGNDLLQGANLPTAVFMPAALIHALGYMVPAGLVHLFIDNAWKTLGERLGTLTYLDDVIIEHCHPLAGKVTHDQGYAEANAPDRWATDEASYTAWRDHQVDGDVARARAQLTVPA